MQTVATPIPAPATGRPMEQNLRGVLEARRARRERGAGDRAGLTPTEVQARLTAFLGTRLDEPFEVARVAQMSGGGANECYAFQLVRGDRSERLGRRVHAPRGS